ncbi:hypothetical protein P5V15_011557 [Pogonomyrmex californicus]
MTLLYKLHQPLRSCYKIHKKAYFLSRQFCNRKVVPLNVIINEYPDIYEKIKGDVSNVQWKSIRERILQKQKIITPAIVDSTIINMCLKSSNLDNAIAYFKFLRENNYPLNTAVIGKYLRLYVLKENLTDADKTEIIETYNTLKQNHPYLDYFTAEQCIISICLTDEWEKAYEIIEMIKMTSSPGIIVYSALISAAFRNGKPNIAWETLSYILSRKMTPRSIVYKSHLQYCQMDDGKAFNSRMEEMFNVWLKYNITPFNEIINIYADTAVKYGWSIALKQIPKKTGNCIHCHSSLAKVTFTKENFQKLTESVIDKLIIGSDIYRNTNPKELDKFKQFIEKTKPYDIVIDGLNLAYIHTKKLPKLLSLVRVVEYFSDCRKKILVVTRKHHEKLPIFKRIRQQATVFLLDDLSADDPYMLYATMASGLNAKFVSLDLMRQHKYSLKDPHLQQEFKKWQFSHQYFVKTSLTGIRIQEPVEYVSTMQKNDNTWHIPYIKEKIINTNLHEFPDNWFCFKYNKIK